MRIRLALAAGITALIASVPGATADAAPPDTTPDGGSAGRIELVVFYGEGCPYCARELAFLDELDERQPLLDVTALEVWHDADNRALFVEMASEHGIEARSVPTTFLGELVWVGFDSSVGEQIEQAVAALTAGRAPEVEQRTTIDVPFAGAVDVGDSSLVAATLLIGFVDGVNPCSLWVLSMLLALVVHGGSRRRMLTVGFVFLSVTATLYGLYMVGAYTALDYASGVTWIRVAVALVAAAFGVLHLKEHLTHRGPSLSIPDDRKPPMLRRMRALARPDRPLGAVLGGTVVLAVGVSLVETPCSAGLPLLWTDLLAARDVAAAGAAVLFGLYLAVFLLDELVLFAVAVSTMRATKLQERHGQVLQLVSGTLMVALAVAMLVAPTALESLTGTAAVFTIAAAVVLAVLAVEHLVAGRSSTRRTTHW